MNNEMLYQLFLNSLSKMNDTELENSLRKAKNMLSENDYAKLLEFIKVEKEKQRKNNQKYKTFFKFMATASCHQIILIYL